MSTDRDPCDAIVACRAADGDDEAFGRLMQRHKQAIYQLMRRYLGNPDEAYEATQETFIAAWLAIGRYDPARPFATWLRTIAINKARDRSRRQAFRRMLFGSQGLEEGGALDAPDTSMRMEDALIVQQQAAAIDEALVRLPTQLKEPLLLTAIEGLSQQQAAEVLGVSVKAVETRVYRARRRLAWVLHIRFHHNAE